MYCYDVSQLQTRNLSVKIKQMRHNTLASRSGANSNVRQAAATGRQWIQPETTGQSIMNKKTAYCYT